MPSSPKDTVGYAVVGLGWISQAAALPGFRNAPNSRVVALVSGDETKRRALAGRYGLGPDDTYDYDDYEACLDRDDVDAVYIGVPNHLHREYTVRAAARRVHVLCEKPMAVTEDECREMVDACRDADVRLMIAYRLHLDAGTLKAVELAGSEFIGTGRVFGSTFTQQVQAGDVRLVPSEQGGGPLYDIGVYCINAARYLFRAEPEAAWATRASRPQDRFEYSAESMACTLRFPGERLATFTCSFGAHTSASLHLVGDRGELRMRNAYDFRGPRVLEWDGEAGGGAETFPETDQFGAQLLYFSDCVLEGRDPEPDGEEGLVDVGVIRALYRSLDEGRMVEVGTPTRERRPTSDMAIRLPAVTAPELVGADDPSP
jgi:predicted dehydrogenase